MDAPDASGSTAAASPGAGASYAETLGERLRNVRSQQDLSLHDVERMTDGTFKASVLGAYERGERSVSVARLRGLADFYRVPVTELMPSQPERRTLADRTPFAGLRIDLARLEVVELPGRPTITRFVESIQARRGDYNGRVITLRRDDLRALAAVLDLSAAELRDRLVQAGVVPGDTVADGWERDLPG